MNVKPNQDPKLAEENGMHGDDRQTCWSHQTWAADCATDPFRFHTSPSVSHYPRPA